MTLIMTIYSRTVIVCLVYKTSYSLGYAENLKVPCIIGKVSLVTVYLLFS